ncbi:MutS-related protein [Algoriphagus machipongonensis]|uniref:MutS domain protein n=1 Tax=Algoriphagus machipongonensis TaxID=388413 RepID=A3HTW4_9BACT|nr:putative MutS domain protein [Algoriphagus machipongonensis]EAZ81586.1 putative MutS domain protein [Algoriphagus machipongonensis]
MAGFDFGTENISAKKSEIKSKAGSLSLVRLMLFIGIVICFVLTFSQTIFWALPLIAITGFFVISIQKYNHLKSQESIYLALEKLQELEAKRKLRELHGIDPGAEYLEKTHPFANDLDLFGEHSLFQLLNHTISQGAKDKLADLMKAKFDQIKAKQYQEASDELSEDEDFLKAMESIGIAFYTNEKPTAGWQSFLKQKKTTPLFISILAYLGPVLGLGLFVAVGIGVLPSAIIGVWILIGMIPLGLVFKELKAASELLPSRNQLKAITNWLFEIEKKKFVSPLLQEKQKVILSKEGSASKLFRSLDRLGNVIDNRINLLYIPFNLLFWTDLFIVSKLQSWINMHGEDLSEIPQILEDWEVLISLGAFEQEIGSKGELVWKEETMISGQEMAHPLLLPEKAVPNDFKLGEENRFVLLTGANMSGKTTFMRTVGINCVMANIGLRPFAKEFVMGDFNLYTSMRNTDNLGESVSSFYAELSRIHQLIERLEKNERIFFLLDEILKGTNTVDRVAGSEALIKQVAKTQGLGIVSTHDIELADLEEKLSSVVNLSFHSEVLDETINFDYKLKSGPCPSFNAHKLMELMGIRFQES